MTKLEKMFAALCAILTIMVGLAFAGVGTAKAAIYCYPNGVVTTCFSEDGRSFSSQDKNVRNPNTIIVPQYNPYPPTWIYHDQQPRRQVPEQDFGECTLALGCIKDRR